MSKSEILQQYKYDVNNLRKCAKELNLSEKEITTIFQDCFTVLNSKNRGSNSKRTSAQKCFIILLKLFLTFIIFAFSIYVLLNVHQPTSSIVLRNVQGLIYPGLKVLRSFAVPIIKQFPTLTGLYDESCLLENPYFYVSNMECWPCEHVHSVIDLTGFDNHSLYQSGTPYIVKTMQKQVTFLTLQHLYMNNQDIFNKEANKVKSNNSSISILEDVFASPNFGTATHISWRINKMSPGQLMRTIFPRPYIISEWSGQSTERYLMLDGPTSGPYSLPNTECSYIFVVQGSGERTIVLKPSQECGETCRTVSVILKPSYVLWYNWWYWRPISLPAENATDSSISYISSYC